LEEHPLTRQIRLPEVGSDGQARLSAAKLEVSGRDGGLIEFVYLHRAGVRSVALLPERQPTTFTHASLFRHVDSRKLAAGAWRALRQIRAVLSLNSDPR
jgi:molybdopterin/thiamine biosynthesis adenylyltransferase